MVDDPKPCVFLDANILIRGVTLPRFPYEILCHADRGDFIPVLSPLVLSSARLYVGDLFPDHAGNLELMLGLLKYELVPDPPASEVVAHPSLVRDLKDIPVALAAILANVDYLVSTDQDFTADDDSTVELRRYLTPMQPGSFLREVMGWTSEALSIIERRRWTDIETAVWDRPRRS